MEAARDIYIDQPWLNLVETETFGSIMVKSGRNCLGGMRHIDSSLVKHGGRWKKNTDQMLVKSGGFWLCLSVSDCTTPSLRQPTELKVECETPPY